MCNHKRLLCKWFSHHLNDVLTVWNNFVFQLLVNMHWTARHKQTAQDFRKIPIEMTLQYCPPLWLQRKLSNFHLFSLVSTCVPTTPPKLLFWFSDTRCKLLMHIVHFETKSPTISSISLLHAWMIIYCYTSANVSYVQSSI